MNKIFKGGSDGQFGLVLNLAFHRKGKWVSAYTPYLVDKIIEKFKPVIITNQLQYILHKKKLKYIISFEPGISSPKIKYDKKIDCLKVIIYSDPHFETDRRMKYFEENGFDYVLSLYKSPFFYHFENFPEQKFIHFPWAVPDQFISNDDIKVTSNDVAIFGGKLSEAYDIRNWCREQHDIKNYQLSGVENKEFSDEDYFKWVSRFDAVIAAGSSNPIYDLVTPKYFEIAASGALLIGQDCKDLEELGFNEGNSLIFTKKNFIEKINNYKNNPFEFISHRINGRNLIAKKHKLTDRIKLIEDLFYG